MKRLLTLALAISCCLATMAAKFNQKIQINVKGSQRTILVYAPDCLTDNRPLVISMHGMNQDINYQKNEAKWELVADTANFLVVYPQSDGTTWDISGTKDIDFILTIIDEMYTSYNIDKNRVYLSGFSMGGMFTYHAMNNIADKIAAFAPISGYTLSNPSFKSARPCPLVHTHGTGDDVVIYDAGQYYGAENTMEGWRKRNGCDDNPTVTQEPSGCCTKTYWKNGECDADVVLYTVKGRGHIPANDNCHHTSIGIWNFVKQYSLDCGKYSETGVSITVSEKMAEAPANITLTAKTSVKGATVVKVEFYQDGELIGISTEEPYQNEVTGLEVGSYEMKAVMTDGNGKTYNSSAVEVTVKAPQQPYNGVAQEIPGKVEVENYDEGEEGFAYHDSDEKDEGSNYRADGVDIEEMPDGKGYALGHCAVGEWLEYTIDAQYTDKYTWTANVSSGLESGAFKLYIDNEPVTNNISIPKTGDNKWDTYKTIEGNELSITEGKHILKLEITGAYGNIDYLEFKAVSPHTSGAEDLYISFQEGTFHIYSLLGEDLGTIKLQSGDNLVQRTEEKIGAKGTYVIRDEAGRSRLLILK